MGYWPELFWKVFYLIFVENIFIMKILTDFRKTLEAGVDPRLLSLKVHLNKLTITKIIDKVGQKN